jgi:hypothetical protein
MSKGSLAFLDSRPSTFAPQPSERTAEICEKVDQGLGVKNEARASVIRRVLPTNAVARWGPQATAIQQYSSDFVNNLEPYKRI